MPRSDKLPLRVIALLQALFSLLGLVMTPVLFNYGGAAANPTGFQLYLLYWLVGLVSAACLFNAQLWARLFALLWIAPLFGAFVYELLQKTYRESAGGRAILAVSALATGYLLVTTSRELVAVYRRANDRRAIRRRVAYAAGAIAVVVIGARLLYLASHTEAALLRKLSSDSEETRCSAAKLLAERGRASAVALPRLVAILGTTTCTQWGQDQLPVYIDSIGGAEPFIELMKNGTGRAQEKAAVHLMYRERLGPFSRADLVAAYDAGLRTGDALVRGVSSEALGFLGRDAESAVHDLITALGDSDAHVRISAAGSLGRLRSLDGLRAALASPDSNVRQTAIEWQGRLRQ